LTSFTFIFYAANNEVDNKVLMPSDLIYLHFWLIGKGVVFFIDYSNISDSPRQEKEIKLNVSGNLKSVDFLNARS
jgi:hypothetical protein